MVGLHGQQIQQHNQRHPAHSAVGISSTGTLPIANPGAGVCASRSASGLFLAVWHLFIIIPTHINILRRLLVAGALSSLIRWSVTLP
jgi:hypothetical protein